jgi:hypothetical protein
MPEEMAFLPLPHHTSHVTPCGYPPVPGGSFWRVNHVGGDGRPTDFGRRSANLGERKVGLRLYNSFSGNTSMGVLLQCIVLGKKL